MSTFVGRIAYDVLTAPLAATDRRTLSQAWYSALHVQRGAMPVEAATSREQGPASPSRRLPQRVPLRCAQTHVASPVGAVALTRDADVHGEGIVDRRAARLRLAQAIERTFGGRQRRVRRATLKLDGSLGRIHVVLDVRGPCARLVALCAPNARREVASALEQARYALAGRGMTLDVRTQVRDDVR
ncbi:MAG: hypothetical protein ACYDHD_07190 [Vulcanimicrobiaceae bacterium]